MSFAPNGHLFLDRAYGSRPAPHRDRPRLGRAGGSSPTAPMHRRWQAVASSCAGAATAAGDTHSRLEAMYCGINVVRHAFGLRLVRGQRAAQPVLAHEGERGPALRVLAHAVRNGVRTHVPLGRLSAGPRVRREPRVGPGRARLAAPHARRMAEVAASSSEPPHTQLARPRDRNASEGRCSAAAASPSGCCSSAAAELASVPVFD